MFPHDREVPNDLFRELSGILLHLGIGTSGQCWTSCDSRNDPDYMTSPNSTAVYSELELNKLLGYVGYIKQVGGKHGFSACVVGKSSALLHRAFLMAFSGRLMNFFSEFLFARD